MEADKQNPLNKGSEIFQTAYTKTNSQAKREALEERSNKPSCPRRPGVSPRYAIERTESQFLQLPEDRILRETPM